MSAPESAAEISPQLRQPDHRWFCNPWLYITLSIVLAAAAQLFLKKAAGDAIGDNVLGFSVLRSGWGWLGILSHIASLLCWLYSLRFIALNIAVNLAGIIHVLVALGSWIFLGENILPIRWIGIFLVVAGVIVIAKPLVIIEEKLEEKL
jgi:multidrug transporter EmrE-like cation transporter